MRGVSGGEDDDADVVGVEDGLPTGFGADLEVGAGEVFAVEVGLAVDEDALGGPQLVLRMPA